MESTPNPSNSEAAQTSSPVQVAQPVKAGGAPAWVVSLLILVMGVMAGFGWRSFIAEPTLPDLITPAETVNSATDSALIAISDQPTSTQPQFFDIPATKRKSFPVTKDGILRLVSVVAGDLVLQYPDEVKWGSGALGLGENEPSSSPDLTKTALITKAGELRVVDSEGKLMASAGTNLLVDYLSGWSTDSQKLAFHVTTPNLSTAIFPDGPIPPDSINQKPEFMVGLGASGFYVLDLAAQKLAYLAPLNEVNLLSWIDAKNLLVTVKQNLTNNEVPAVFNTETYQANAGDYKDLFKDWFGPQMSFSQDGQKWAITIHKPAEVNGPDSKATIVLASFPARSGVTVAEGKFAAIQGAKISPDGTKTIFRAYDEVNGPNFVQLYANGQVKRISEGIPLRWIDNNAFIYAIFSPNYASNPAMAQKYLKYDLATDQTTDLLVLPAGE